MNNELYSVLKETIEYVRDYYFDWQDYIERFSFPRMDYYFLIINISSFYRMIDLVSYRLEKWDREDEIELFNILSFIPKKIRFTNSIYDNFKIIKECLEYNDAILKKYEKD